jgi:REP element-mobilizing transposase RayT
LHRHLPHLSALADQPIVFFTVVTHHRITLLDNPGAHTILRGVWERSAELNGWYVGDYILMPDHVHFFARASRTADAMRTWVKMWKSVSARQIVTTLHIAGPVWQKDYFDRYLRSGESYSEKWEYVKANPVRAGLVEHADQWPYGGHIHPLTF